jgi:DNA-binding transcriptional regulator YdaS (Cro superfamily)
MSNKYTPKPALRAWLEAATPAMKKELCSYAGTANSMLRQWRVGRRDLSAEKAGQVSLATHTIKALNPEAPEPLSRGDLCNACRTCPYFHKK